MGVLLLSCAQVAQTQAPTITESALTERHPTLTNLHLTRLVQTNFICAICNLRLMDQA